MGMSTEDQLSKLDFLERVGGLASKYDLNDSLYWHGAFDRIFINCNDLFFWGCADGEEITPENLPRLEALAEELNDLGRVDAPFYNSNPGYEKIMYHNVPAYLWLDTVFCARERGERPQGAWWSRYPEEIKELLRAAGPEKEVGLGNPYGEEGAPLR